MYKKIYNRLLIALYSIFIRLLAFTRGSWISLGATVYIHSGARLEIGSGVRVAQGSVLSILPGAVLTLNDGCIINHGVTVYCASRIVVGSYSRIAHYCSILDHDYDIHSGDSWFKKPKITLPIIIGEHVWLGAYVSIFKGVTIGRRCVIGAQTMIRKSIPERMLVYCHSNSQMTLKEL